MPKKKATGVRRPRAVSSMTLAEIAGINLNLATDHGAAVVWLGPDVPIILQGPDSVVAAGLRMVADQIDAAATALPMDGKPTPTVNADGTPRRKPGRKPGSKKTIAKKKTRTKKKRAAKKKTTAGAANG